MSRFFDEFAQAAQKDAKNPLTLKQRLAIDFDHCTPEHPCFFPMGAAGDVELFGGLLQKLGVPLEKAAERLARLSPRQKDVLDLLRPFFEGGPRRTYTEVGKMLEPPVSLERVRQIEATAHRLLTNDHPFVGLSVRSANALRSMGLSTPEEVASLTEREFYYLPNVARKSFDEVKAWLAEHGLSFKK